MDQIQEKAKKAMSDAKKVVSEQLDKNPELSQAVNKVMGVVNKPVADLVGTKEGVDGSSSGMGLINFIIICIAVYLALKCRIGDHNMLLHALGAVCCSPCYIAYHLISAPCGKIF